MRGGGRGVDGLSCGIISLSLPGCWAYSWLQEDSLLLSSWEKSSLWDSGWPTFHDKYRNFMCRVPPARHVPPIHLHCKFSQFPFEVGRILSILQMRKPRLRKL